LAGESPFHVSLEAGKVGSSELNPNVLSVRLAQNVLRSNVQEMWNSVSIYCEKEATGALVVRVMVFNPDWDTALQIAELRSWPGDEAGMTPGLQSRSRGLFLRSATPLVTC
jgi:hypothetical protein